MTQKDTVKCRHCGKPISKVILKTHTEIWYHEEHGYTCCRNEDREGKGFYSSKFTKEEAEPFSFKDYLKQVESLWLTQTTEVL